MSVNPKTLRHARQLRQTMTPAEVIIWRRLRDRRFAEFKFRRQHPIGMFIVDFCFHECKLNVELDGDSHVGKESADRRRQAVLEEQGFVVLRFWNPQVYDELDSVLDTIYLHCVERGPRREGDCAGA